MNRLNALLCASLLLLPLSSHSYPNGTLFYVTDMVPACAACHAAHKAEYMPEVPPPFAQSELIENKHYGLVRSPMPPSPYLELTPAQKEALIATAKRIDESARIELAVPAEAAAGERITVQVKAVGGNGPVIGIMLVDRPLRFQAQPIAATGWLIEGEPLVKGQDGKSQTTWLDRRMPGAARNLGFILVMDQAFDLERRVFPAADVRFTLKTPLIPGDYSLTAALLYGTENAAQAGFFQRPSGRILFTEEMKIKVK